MATRTVGARVQLDGEKEYKQALQELNTGNRTLASEMRKLQAEYRGNEESTEALTKKGDLLNRQLLQQQDKVKTLQEALAASAKQFGEADSRTQKYAQQLNYAEAELFDLQHAIEENDQALKGQGQTMAGLGDTVSDLTSKLGIHLPDGAKNALNGMKSLSSGTVVAMGAVVAGIAAAVKAVKELGDMTIQASMHADDLITTSMTTGIGTELLQQLQYAEPLIDVSVDTIAGSLTKLTKNISDAAGGNEGLAESFRSLGVNITNEADGSLRSAQDVFFDIIDALGGIENVTERDAAAMALMGKSAQQLNPLIIQGTGALQELMTAAGEVYVLTDDQIGALGGLNDAVESNTLLWDGLKNQLAAQFAPAMTTTLTAFGELVSAAGKALIDSKIIEGVGEILEMLVNMFSPLTELLSAAEGSVGKLQPVYTVLHSIAGVLAWIADAGNVVVGILQTITGNFSGGLTRIGTALGYGASSGNYSNPQRWQGYGNTSGNYYDPNTGLYTGNYFAGNAGGTDNWRGGMTWVGEAGPELLELPRGSRIYSAQESREISGGDTIINVTVNGIQELEEVVNWYESRRVRARMR